MPKPTEKVVFDDFAKIPKLAKWKYKDGDDTLMFAQAVREYRECNAMEATIKARKKEISEALVAAMIVSGQKRAGVDDVPVTLARGKNSKIDAMLLLQKGVDSDTINECTVIKEYDYVTVGKAEAGE